MASIKKRHNGKWRARYRDEAGKEHARHFGRRVDAQKWLDEQTATLVTRHARRAEDGPDDRRRVVRHVAGRATAPGAVDGAAGRGAHRADQWQRSAPCSSPRCGRRT